VDGVKVRRQRWLLYVVTSLGCSVLLASPVSSSTKNDLDRLDLRGAVRRVVTKHPQLTTMHQFDRDGHLTALDLTAATEAESARYVYLYDSNGRLVEEQTYEPDHTLGYRKLFRYALDEQARESAQVAATDEGLFAHALFSLYDVRGLLTEELLITGQGVAEKSLYDARGNLVYHARHFQGRLVLEETHYYDPLDRLQESRFYGSDGGLMRRDRYRYDRAGNAIEQTSEYSRQSHLRKSVVTFEFDGAGNWVKETVQRWANRNGAMVQAENVISRERIITYY
jgi:YD repeat-containing protein